MAPPRIDGEIAIDGRGTELAWDAVSPLPLTMYRSPHEGGVKEPSEIRVAYDDECPYVSG
jgi:hypothetical protein